MGTVVKMDKLPLTLLLFDSGRTLCHICAASSKTKTIKGCFYDDCILHKQEKVPSMVPTITRKSPECHDELSYTTI
jgi:hypothetical protein